MKDLYLRICLLLPAACLAAGTVGCQTLDFYDQTLQEPVPLVMEPPREMAMMSLPAYRIEPPDVLLIEVLKLVPRPPYRSEIFDVLQIRATGTFVGPEMEDLSIDDFYLIESEGTVNLGPIYGKVRVAGMTIQEATEAITSHLKKRLRAPEVSVQLARAAGTQPITGEYLVGPDGTVNLRQYGSVHVVGKTITEAKVALTKHLSQFFDSPDVSIQVIGFNSKVYYVVTEGAGLGDNVVRMPVTGNETVLDALSNVGGLPQLSSKKVWIARPAPGGFGCDQILPVDYDAITQGASTATNYQLLPDDRVFIAEDRLIATATFINKVTDPIQRLLGFTSLGLSTVRSGQALGGRFRGNY